MTTKKKDNFTSIFSLGAINRILKVYTQNSHKLSALDKKLIQNFFEDSYNLDLHHEQ